MKRVLTTIIALSCFIACDTRASGPTDESTAESASESTGLPDDESSETTEVRQAGQKELDQLETTYRWLENDDETPPLAPMSRRFAAPDGWSRVAVEPGSFGHFLRDLPMRLDRTKVLSYRGERLGSPSAGIVYIDVGTKNLQQCADSAIRLHAEWLWSTEQRDDLAYHFTSGDRTAWTDYAAGERFRIAGSKVDRVRSGASSSSRSTFREWLDLVFMYAGTRSLRHDSKQISPTDVKPGDFWVAPGSPGHAVIVLDLVENESGDKMALLGQGFMPAQELHVIRGASAVDGVWWPVPTEGELDTPSWKPFGTEDLRRFD